MIADKLIEIAKSEIGYLEKSKEAVEADPDVLYDFTKAREVTTIQSTPWNNGKSAISTERSRAWPGVRCSLDGAS